MKKTARDNDRNIELKTLWIQRAVYMPWPFCLYVGPPNCQSYTLGQNCR